MIDRRLVANIDWLLVGATLLLTLVGILMVFSATEGARRAGASHRLEDPSDSKSDSRPLPPRKGRPPATKQMLAAGIGVLALLVTLGLDYRRLADRAGLLYVAAAAALAAAL